MSMQEFTQFFEAVYRTEPFPWQRRLVARVLAGEGWPSAIALPTAAGKTAVIDIAVFALSMSGHQRPQPRRIFFVVDRRIVVDAAYSRALGLARKLEAAHDGGPHVLRNVADRLMALGGDVPLHVAALRGGVYRDHAWARSPAQPLVCVTTVDQIGSRLLFRGYGLARASTNMLPIHAGLVGNDALIVLDEAHISRPFDETLAAVARYRTWADAPISTPWEVVRMSATPAPDVKDVLREGEGDREHPILGQRLRASKRASLLEVKGDRTTAEELASAARQLLADDDKARVVGVIANRVATARDAFKLLRRDDGEDAVLLIGRCRPSDRDRLLAEYLGRAAAGRRRSVEDRPLFVVATQCIEVGADLDFDALVTECAALDALRQRFGRLDRLGTRGTTASVIVIHKSQTGKNAVDPVYGSSLAQAWQWLCGQIPSGKGADRTVDFGVAAFGERAPEGEELERVSSPRRRAPVMLPAHLDRWAQTSPVPSPDPDPGLFLHGPETSPADVQLVWRCDLPLENPLHWTDVVALLPPASPECMPVPFLAARDWLAGRGVRDVADVESELVEVTADAEPAGPRERRALRWQGAHAEGTGIVMPSEIRPGDTLIVPSSYGGADRYGWEPGSAATDDIAEAASVQQRLRSALRLHPTVLASVSSEPEPLLDLLADLRAALEANEPIEPAERDLLDAIAADDGAEDWAREAARRLVADRHRRRISYPDGSGGVVVLGSRRLEIPTAAASTFDQITDEDIASSLTRRISLEQHTSGVRARTRRFAAQCHLPDQLLEHLALAAELHDLGNADPRFQLMLRGGDASAAPVADERIAKSDLSPRDRWAICRAFEQSGLPRGYRHEATSVALALSDRSVLGSATDPDLVLHLIASHHGAARPFLPPIEEPSPTLVSVPVDGTELQTSTDHRLARLDSGVSDRFWACVRRYGWYGLAYLEAILRLADHRTSEAEAVGSE